MSDYFREDETHVR